MSQIQTKFIANSAITTPKVAADAIDGTKIRLANNQALRARNAADDANIDLLKLNASDVAEMSTPLAVITAAGPEIARFEGTTPAQDTRLVVQSDNGIQAVLTAGEIDGNVFVGSNTNHPVVVVTNNNPAMIFNTNGIVEVTSNSLLMNGNAIFGPSTIRTNLDTSDSIDIGSGSNSSGASGSVLLSTGDGSGAPSGNLTVTTGDAPGGAQTGDVYVSSGTASASGTASGLIQIRTGDTASAATGAVLVSSGDAAGAANVSGALTLQTGNSAAGDSGSVTIQSGTAPTLDDRGSVILDAKRIDIQEGVLKLKTSASDPTALAAYVAGDTYFNTTSDTVRVYDGAAWVDAVPASSAPTYEKAVFTLSAGDITNQYIDLSHVALTNSIDFYVRGGGIQAEGASYDYSVNYTGGAGGNTRITFLNDLATAGASALVAGDVVIVKYVR